MTLWGTKSLLLVLVALLPSSRAFITDADSPFQLKTDVSETLKLALDIKDMRATASDYATKKSIYENGKNAAPLSLKQLSIDAERRWGSSSPMYNLYRHAFTQIGKKQEHDTTGDFDGSPAIDYADTLVQDLFELQVEHIEAEAAVVFNVLMAFWSELADLLTSCWSVADGQSTTAEENPRMLGFLDQAVALWVGAEQGRGEASSGYFLYNMAQVVGERFDQGGSANGEVKKNELMIFLFNGIQSKIEGNQCEELQGYAEIRMEIQALISESNAVLVQMLLNHMESPHENKADFVEMYILAIIPQVATCDEGSYQTLLSDAVSASITDESKPKVISALQKIYSCLHIDCEDVGTYEGIPACDDSSAAGLPSLVDYLPTEDVRMRSYLDRDMRQIRVFMELEAYEIALDFFLFGWNSDTSLGEITEEQTNDEVKLFLEFTTEDEYFPEALILACLEKIAPFDTITAEERTDVVMSALQSNVMYWSVVEELYESDQACKAGDLSQAKLHWDSAAAYFIGSAEGQSKGGQEGGEFLFAVEKKLCSQFGTCEPTSSEADRAILTGLKTGQDFLRQGECELMEDVLSSQLYPSLRIPLFQGTLYYTSQSAASAIAYSRAILPAINEKSPESATTIQTNTDFFFTAGLSPDFPAVVGAFQTALEAMTTDCEDVGDLALGSSTYGFCPGDVIVPEPTPTDKPVASPTTSPVATTDSPVSVTSSPVATTAPTTPVTVPQPTQSPEPPRTSAPIHPAGIAWGQYVFSNDQVAENDSKFALDIKEMYLAASPADADRVYSQASTNVPGGLTGIPLIRSLQDFSTQAAQYMSEDPMYNFFRVALYDDMSFDDTLNAEGWPFGNSVVELALGVMNGNSTVLGARAAVVMNVWMMITNRLYEAVRQCQSGIKPLVLIDSAVALWIGQEQSQAGFGSGWMIYSLAQEALQLYGNEAKQAPVNTDLLTLFNALKEGAALCEPNSQVVFLELRALVDVTVRLLSVPLLQNLLYYMSVDDFEYVELFALSFTPQAVSCNEGTYRSLRDTLYEGFKRDEDMNSPAFLDKMGEFLRCLEMSCGDLGDVTNAGPELQTLVTNLCQQLEPEHVVAGYETLPLVNLEKLHRIDLDIHQMELFMRVRAYGLAAEIYEHGRNCIIDTNKQISLQQLFEDLKNTGINDMLFAYDDYFKQSSYGQADIVAAISQGQGTRFEGASRRQLSEVTFRTSQAVLSFMLTIGKLRGAVNMCKADEDGQNHVDQAVAVFVGSMEGRSAGGDTSNSGKMMYALAKEVCKAFGRCENHGEARSNQVIMYALSDVKTKINAKECLAAEALIEETILPMMKVPLVQGTLYFANVNVQLPPQGNNETLASGDILSRSILPLVNAVDQVSAAVISENMEFSRSSQPVKGGVSAVFDAFAKTLSGMGVDCNAIGPLGSLSTCPANVTDPDTPTNLGKDLYITETYVQDRANIALDIRDMEEELSFGNKDQALLVYEEGRNSEVFDSLGRRIDLRSLASFSTEATTTNPLYTVAVYALRDDKGEYRGRDAWLYADTIVKSTLESTPEKSTLAADAAVVLNLWMELANELYSTVTRCKGNLVRDTDGIKSVDEAVAYWIGDGQIGGDSERGHLLYALAEQMGEVFKLSESGQSRVNVNILRLFQQAKIELSLPDACAEPGTAHRVQHVVNKIVTQMITLNVQALIHHLREENRDAAHVYAHAFVPLVAACSPESFKYLREKLLDDSVFPVAEVEDIIQVIYLTFPCFSIQCDDIGVHNTETISTCEDPPPRPALAGYTPSSAVEEYAQLDLDILELGILMDMEAYGAAEDLYAFGKHVPTVEDAGRTALSLKYLARRTSRSNVPQIELFQKYFGNDETYADTLIQSTFTDTNGYSAVQRRVLATGFSRYMVMFSAVLEEMGEAVDTCESGDSSRQDEAAEAWDRAASYVIGHLEGSSESGSSDGLLLWALSKQTCEEFGTCSKELSGSSMVNDKISTLLYAGRGAILGSNCDELQTTSRELVPLLQTPLIQASLSSITKLDARGTPSDELRAEAHVFALSLLPLIDDANREGAVIIRTNMGLEGAAIPLGAPAVASAFSRSLNGLEVDCREVGVSEEINACTGVVSSSNTGAIIAGTIIGVVAFVFLLFLCRRRGRKIKRKKAEENVEFVPPKGELNHDTDLLPGEHDPRRKDAETDFLTGNDADAAMADDEHALYDDYDDDYDDEAEEANSDVVEESDSSSIV